MTYAIKKDGEWQEISGAFTDNDGVQHPRGWIAVATADELAEVGVVEIVEIDIPEGQRVTASRIEEVDGGPTRVYDLEPIILPPATRVTPRQLKLVLHTAGLLDGIEQFVATKDKAVQISWEYATEFLRSDPLINQMAPLVGLTAEQVDDLFTQAAAIG